MVPGIAELLHRDAGYHPGQGACRLQMADHPGEQQDERRKQDDGQGGSHTGSHDDPMVPLLQGNTGLCPRQINQTSGKRRLDHVGGSGDQKQNTRQGKGYRQLARSNSS
ncbi:hypothetical protein D3C75_1108800 [compost metagenome]